MTTSDAAAWRERRAAREEGLRAEHGWLTLTSLTWIGNEPHQIEDFPGTWQVVGESLQVAGLPEDAVLPDEAVLPEGDAAAGAGAAVASWTLSEDASADGPVVGTKLAEIAKRGGRYAVRVRDEASPTRTDFTGVPTWDHNPAAVVTALIELIEPRVIPRATAHPMVPGTAHVVAQTTLTEPAALVHHPHEHDAVPGQGAADSADAQGAARPQHGQNAPHPAHGLGEEHGEPRLAVVLLEGDPTGTLVLNFHDATNGEESAAWRFVTFRSPFADDPASAELGASAQARIDFNDALNFPSAFTDFGTCPRPVRGNELPWPVRAGEKRPA